LEERLRTCFAGTSTESRDRFHPRIREEKMIDGILTHRNSQNGPLLAQVETAEG
jgi:hypothetical protein